MNPLGHTKQPQAIQRPYVTYFRTLIFLGYFDHNHSFSPFAATVECKLCRSHPTSRTHSEPQDPRQSFTQHLGASRPMWRWNLAEDMAQVILLTPIIPLLLVGVNSSRKTTHRWTTARALVPRFRTLLSHESVIVVKSPFLSLTCLLGMRET